MGLLRKRYGNCSAVFRELPFVAVGTNRDPQPDIMQRVRPWENSSRWNVSNQSLPSVLRELLKRGDKKSIRARGDGGHQRNKTLQVSMISTHMDS